MKNRKTTKKSSYEDLDNTTLVQSTKGTGHQCLDQSAKNKQNFCSEALGLEGNIDASSGWLTRLKQRHGICEICIQGEKLTGDFTAANKFCVEFQELNQSYYQIKYTRPMKPVSIGNVYYQTFGF
jgi:hypothetical protein